jgi:hypothetical protein
VLSGIEVIARAGNPLPERRAEAAQRISQFDTDLAASGRPAGMVEERRNQLRAMLEEAAGNRNRPSDERSVYRNALDRLTGADGAPEKSPAGGELGGNGNNEMTAESRHRIDAMCFRALSERATDPQLKAAFKAIAEQHEKIADRLAEIGRGKDWDCHSRRPDASG